MQALKTHFDLIFPELKSRLNYLSRHYADREEAYSEMLAFCWTNALSKYKRTGELLSCPALAFVAHKRHHSGRVISGYSVRDAMADQTFKSGRARVIYLSQLTTSKKQHTLDDGTVKKIIGALSSSWRERPDHLAAVRIDWGEFTKSLDQRFKIIVQRLSVGELKSDIAKRLKISCGRLSQLLEVLALKVIAFFGEELPVNFVRAYA